MMSLEYKPEWEETKQRFLAWWAGEAIGRCALGITAPRDDGVGIERPEYPSDPLERWTDLGFIAALNEYEHSTTFYGGEAIPVWHGGYPGHTSCPAFLGCPTALDEHTGWWDPIFDEDSDDWDATSLAVDPENAWWQFTLAQARRSLVECAGKSIPCIGGALGGCGDTLAALRGSLPLLYDVTLVPDRVREAELHLMDIWIDVYGALYQIDHEAAEGSTVGWFPLWSPGRFYVTHCDFSYMISTEMFCDLFIPALERQTEYLDHCVHHTDGIEAFRHVSALCDLPRLDALQILPGAGKPSPLHYIETLRLVQALGKNLHITIPPEEVETALELLSARGLFISTHCETEEQARYLLKKAEKWSHD
jgi:5-methyltetrahydrofolate--homocysteine methyltransferase